MLNGNNRINIDPELGLFEQDDDNFRPIINEEDIMTLHNLASIMPYNVEIDHVMDGNFYLQRQ